MEIPSGTITDLAARLDQKIPSHKKDESKSANCVRDLDAGIYAAKVLYTKFLPADERFGDSLLIGFDIVGLIEGKGASRAVTYWKYGQGSKVVNLENEKQLNNLIELYQDLGYEVNGRPVQSGGDVLRCECPKGESVDLKVMRNDKGGFIAYINRPSCGIYNGSSAPAGGFTTPGAAMDAALRSSIAESKAMPVHADTSTILPPQDGIPF